MRVSSLIISVIFAFGGLVAQSPEETHNELRKLKTEITAAANKKDYAALLNHLHPNVVITWQDAQVCRGRAQVEAYLHRMADGPNAVVESFQMNPSADELTILYGDTGVAFGGSTDEFKLKSRLQFTQKSRWTATMVKFEGRWVVASLHASVDVFDNPLLAAAKKTGMGLGIGGLVIGVLIGWMLGRRKR